MKAGLYKVFQWNGKDLFLQSAAAEDEFVVLSFDEIAHESRERLCQDKERGFHDREVMLMEDRKMAFILLPEEMEANRIRRLRVADLLAAIAGIEAGGDNLPAYAKAKLTMLRAELCSLIPVDPTAVTLEQQRANSSIEMVDFKVGGGRE